MISYRHCEHGYTTPCPLCEELGKGLPTIGEIKTHDVIDKAIHEEIMSAPIGNTDWIRYVKPGELEKENRRRSGECAFNCSRGFHERDNDAADLLATINGHVIQLTVPRCKYCRSYFEERT